jgi:hypothetical protein
MMNVFTSMRVSLKVNCGMKILPTTHNLKASALLLAVCFVSLLLKAADETPVKGKAVEHQRISTGDYQNFIGTWDEKKNPVLCAVVRSPSQYNALFHPAATMRNKLPFAPDAGLYKKEQILVVARVMTAPDDMDKVFAVEKVVEAGQDLMLYYRLEEPKTKATYTVKNFLALRVPQRDYQRVLFFENGKQVGELKPATGTWSVPAFEVK